MIPGRSYFLQGKFLPEDFKRQFAKIDQLVFDGAELDIKTARSLVATSSQQPYGDKRLIVIEAADKLSEAVQNTLLKLLEEPPHYLVVILTAMRPAAFLPTVRSRLHELVQTQSKETVASNSSVPELDELRTAVLQAKDRAKLTTRVEEFRDRVWASLLEQPSGARAEAVDLLDRTVRRLQHNANQKLVIDALLLNWPL